MSHFLKSNDAKLAVIIRLVKETAGFGKKTVSLLNPVKNFFNSLSFTIFGAILGVALGKAWDSQQPKQKEESPSNSVIEYRQEVPPHIQRYLEEHAPNKETPARQRLEQPDKKTPPSVNSDKPEETKIQKPQSSFHKHRMEFHAALEGILLPQNRRLLAYRPRSHLPFRAEHFHCR